MAWNKLCFVPFCKVSGTKNPDKVFFCVPRNPVERLRWLNAVKRDPSSVSKNTRFYCCQDHFDVDKDVINFESYKSHRGPFKVCFRYGAVPSKFDCFKNKRVRSVEELRKKRIVVSEETIKLFVSPAADEADFEGNVDEPQLISDGADDLGVKDWNENVENESATKEVTTLHSLEEINDLLLDINNLGILGSVLSAYDNIYRDQNKWSIKFNLKNGGSCFEFFIRKISKQIDSLGKQGMRNNVNFTRFTVNKAVLPPVACKEGMLEDSNSSGTCTVDALARGGHIYSNSFPSQIVDSTRTNCLNQNGSKVSVEDILPKDKVAPVYQCDYCCYGSLYKYRLKHHITSKHHRRFTDFKEDRVVNKIATRVEERMFHDVLYDELNLSKNDENYIETNLPFDNIDCSEIIDKIESSNMCCETERRNKMKKGKRKKLSYYMSYSKAHEIKRLQRQIQSRRDWLEDFLKSFNRNKSKPVSKNKNIRKTYSCVLCQFTSTDQTEVYKHTGLTHVYENTAYLECPSCECKAVDKVTLADHLSNVHCDDDYFKCKMCGEEMKSNDEYFRHVCEVHGNSNIFRCSQCKYTCLKHELLQKHINFTHKRISKFECGEYGCGFEALTEDQLRSDVDEMHQTLRPFICSEINCNYGAASHSLLVQHMDQSHGIENQLVDEVGLVDDISYEIRDEDLIETLDFDREETIGNMDGMRKLYRCSECTFSSSGKSTIDAHIREVHQGYFPFKCNLCDFKTSVKRKFQMHYDAVHLKKKPYKCSHCNTRFAQRGHVVRHIQDIHLKEKPNLCSFCKYCTANRANLKAHLKAIHKIPDEDIKEVLKSCVNLRKQEPNESEFNKIIIYDTVDLLPDDDPQTSQIIQELGMIVE